MPCTPSTKFGAETNALGKKRKEKKEKKKKFLELL
jgi:hypothetical protein